MFNLNNFEAFASQNNLPTSSAAKDDTRKALPLPDGNWNDENRDTVPHGDLQNKDYELPKVYLPSNLTTTLESATSLMKLIAPKHEVFSQGDSLVVLSAKDNGSVILKELTTQAFRSLAEKHAKFVVRKQMKGKNGMNAAEPRLFTSEHASGIMACQEAINILPRIKVLTSFPPMLRDGTLQEEAYDPSSGILVNTHFPVETPTVEEGVRIIREMLRDFQFASPADESRAIAAILAPMLRLGFWQGEKIVFPMFIIEADQSQTGKGYLTKAIAEIYNEVISFVAQPKRGVGSFDESFSKILLRGRPLICLDNLRGKLDSQVLESFLTATGPVYARALRTDGEVDSRYYVLYATSNGMESTQDIANRMCLVRILHHPEGYQFHEWPEGSLLNEVKANRGKYLGAICAVLREWVNRGEPIIRCQHDQLEWAGAMNYIVQEIFHLPPLLDGFEEIKKRVSSPGLALLREIALTIRQNEVTYNASQLVDVANENGFHIPGWDETRNEPKALNMHMGSLLGRCFLRGDSIEIDGITITRGEVQVDREESEGGSYKQKNYTFRQAGFKPAEKKKSSFNVPPLPPYVPPQ